MSPCKGQREYGLHSSVLLGTLVASRKLMNELEASKVAVVLLDVINGFDFDGSEGLVLAARMAAPKILLLRERAHEANVPVIYVNESFGRPEADFAAVVAACSAHDQPGHDVARMLVPTEHDQVLLKTGRSAFDGAELDSMLQRLGVQRLILSGFATDSDLLATATDAHERGYEVLVPGDCTAATSPQLSEHALEQMQKAVSARTEDSLQIDLAALRY